MGLDVQAAWWSSLSGMKVEHIRNSGGDGAARVPEGTLEAHPFTRDLEARHIERIRKCARSRHFEPGQFLERQGKQAEEFFLILSGSVSLEISVPNQGAIQLDSLRGGHVLGWSCIVLPHELRFDARAMTSVSTIALRAEDLRRLCEQDAELGYELLKRFTAVIGSRLDATRSKLLESYAADLV